MENQPLQPERRFKWWYLVLAAVLLNLIILLVHQLTREEYKSPARRSAKPDTATGAKHRLEAERLNGVDVNAVSNWDYSNDEDKMGTRIKTATSTAKEVLEFDFPYQGGSIAYFTIRRKGGQTDMYLRVSKGQFIANTYDESTCRIRFDQGKPVTFGILPAADYSSDIIFFESEQAILKRIRKAKKIVVEVEFYKEGKRQIEFDVNGLKW